MLLLCFIISDVSSQVFASDAIYNPKPVKAINKPLRFEYVFKEFKDSGSYINSIKTINWFRQFKKPLFKIENTTYYNPSLQFYIIDSLLKKRRILLNSLHYYLDVKKVEKFETHIEVNTRLPYEYIYQPFFIGNGEVTNAEYREFIHYVRDSIARALLAYSSLKNAKEYGSFDEANQQMTLKWNKKISYNSSDDETRDALQPMYTTWPERFYNRQEIDVRKLNYKFWLINDSVEIVINVVPDTLVWVNDLILTKTSCSLESYCNMYLWHPVYDNYPVVGLTCDQIKAFLFWKTQKLQREMDKNGSNLLVEYDLPNEVELEMIHILNELNSKTPFRKKIVNYDEVAKNYDFDLYLNAHSKIHYEADKQLNLSNRAGLLINEVCVKYQKSIRFIFPSLGGIESKKMNTPSLANYNNLMYNEDLPFLNGNVSEWMHENLSNDDSTWYVSKEGKINKWSNTLSNRSITFPFKGNFEDAYVLNKRLDNSINDFESLKFKLIDSLKLKNDLCKLVRGANWFDSGDYGTASLKKTFVPIDSAYSTLGFRYVVRFKKK